MARTRRTEGEDRGERGGLLFALGATAGIAVGMLLSGRRTELAEAGERMMRGTRDLAGRFRPGGRELADDERLASGMDPQEEDVGWRRGDGGEWGGRTVGMGRRRQGRDTEPDRADDSRDMRARELDTADREQYEDEDLAHAQPRVGARPGHGDAKPAGFAEEELDNQTPYGQHAASVPEQPQALNADSRVGEGTPPGVELRLEAADLPVKPHSGRPRRD